MKEGICFVQPTVLERWKLALKQLLVILCFFLLGLVLVHLGEGMLCIDRPRRRYEFCDGVSRQVAPRARLRRATSTLVLSLTSLAAGDASSSFSLPLFARVASNLDEASTIDFISSTINSVRSANCTSSTHVAKVLLVP